MDELETLVAAQERDDRNEYQDPERLGGLRTAPLDKFIDAGLDTDGLGGAAQVQTADEKPGVWRQDRVETLFRARTVKQRDAMFAAFEELLAADVTLAQREAIRLVVYGQKSHRDAAEILGIHHKSVQERLTNGFARLRAVLTQRFGLDDLTLPTMREFRAEDACPSYLCEGHFVEMRCESKGCPTLLPKHYNPRTTCRRHSTQPSQADHVLSSLIGTANTADSNVGSVAVPISSLTEATR